MKEIIKKYSNGKVTVVWQPVKCIHSKKCFHGLPQVFDPSNRPWVNIEGDNSAAIVDQVKLCPSGALSIEQEASSVVESIEVFTIQVLADGPLMVKGQGSISGVDGKSTACEGTTALCRCGESSNKPYCDGSHATVGFKDPE